MEQCGCVNAHAAPQPVNLLSQTYGMGVRPYREAPGLSYGTTQCKVVSAEERNGLGPRETETMDKAIREGFMEEVAFAISLYR